MKGPQVEFTADLSWQKKKKFSTGQRRLSSWNDIFKRN